MLGLIHMQIEDGLQDAISRVVTKSSEPLETKEIRDKVADMLGEEVTRSKLLYRLNDLRGRGEILGKNIGSGKGVWIWWKNTRR